MARIIRKTLLVHRYSLPYWDGGESMVDSRVKTYYSDGSISLSRVRTMRSLTFERMLERHNNTVHNSTKGLTTGYGYMPAVCCSTTMDDIMDSYNEYLECLTF